MTRRGRRTLIAALIGLIALACGAVLWPRPDRDLRLVENRLVGETAGYVTSVGAGDQTLRVSPSVFGLRSVTVHVGQETTIFVGDKEGALADLRPGMPVRVGYHMEGDRRVAEVIELDLAGRPRRQRPLTAARPESTPGDSPDRETTDAPNVLPAQPSAAAPPRDEVATTTSVDSAAPVEVKPTPPPPSRELPPAPPPAPRELRPAPPPARELRPAPPPASRELPPAPPPRQSAARAARPSSPRARVDVPAPLPQTLPPRELLLDLTASVHEWVQAAKRRNVSAQVTLYAETIGSFYGRRDVSREHVRAEKLRAFGSGEALIDTGSPEIRLDPSGRVAIVRFNKWFVVDRDGQARHGNGVQELQWERTHDGWRIVGETDMPLLSRGRRDRDPEP